MLDHKELQWLQKIAKAVAAQFGDGCEVVIHDLAQGSPEHSIVAIENGQLTQHVSEMNITGNFTDIMLRLSEVGNDPKRDATHQIPSLRFDDVAFSGT